MVSCPVNLVKMVLTLLAECGFCIQGSLAVWIPPHATVNTWSSIKHKICDAWNLTKS